MKERPVFLNLLQIHLPLPALISIGHRISGIILAFMMPVILWLLSCVIRPDFPLHIYADCVFGTIWGRVFLWLLSCAAVYHVLAGVRHVLGDMHWIKHDLDSAKWASVVVIILFLVVSVALAINFWSA